MRLFAIAAAALIATGVAVAPAPVLAQHGPGTEMGHRPPPHRWGHGRKVCRTVWHHHRKVRRCFYRR